MDIEKLKALALAATPGPWDLEDGEVGHDVAPFVFVHKPDANGIPDDGLRIKVEKHHMHPARKPVMGGPAWNRLADCAILNAQFIAAAHPAAVLELIAEVERLSQDAERYRKIKADNKRSADSTFCLFLDSGGNLLPVASMDMDNEIDVAIEEGRDNT